MTVPPPDVDYGFAPHTLIVDENGCEVKVFPELVTHYMKDDIITINGTHYQVLQRRFDHWTDNDPEERLIIAVRTMGIH